VQFRLSLPYADDPFRPGARVLFKMTTDSSASTPKPGDRTETFRIMPASSTSVTTARKPLSGEVATVSPAAHPSVTLPFRTATPTILVGVRRSTASADPSNPTHEHRSYDVIAVTVPSRTPPVTAASRLLPTPGVARHWVEESDSHRVSRGRELPSRPALEASWPPIPAPDSATARG
jgi:hypothetical protein